jgi:hypothetical protein
MAATAAESRSHVAEALDWVDQCATYALESGNRHEHAHAELTRARLVGRPADGTLTAAARVFRAVGDLRCLTRCHLMLAEALPPAAAVAELESALLVAGTARDAAHQEAALAGLVRGHWAAGAPRQAAVALGRLAALVGADRANAACPGDMRDQLAGWTAAVAEGRARGVPAARASTT